MTLALATVTSDGIILSADSRQTYRNTAGMIRIGSDSAMKIFQLNERVGVAIAGKAFIVDSNGSLRNVGAFIREFRQTKLDPKSTTKEVAASLSDYLGGLYVEREMAALRQQIIDEVGRQGGKDLNFNARDGNLQPYSFKNQAGQVIQPTGSIDTVSLVVAGIDDDKVGRAYVLHVPKGISIEKDTRRCGALWIGQADVLTRIIKGYDPAIEGIAFVQAALKADQEGVLKELNGLEYLVNWGTMTLQDAIDFCVLVTRTTESVQRFSDGTARAPGGITGVGGDISVAAITPERGFVWMKKRQLSAEGVTVDIEGI